MENEFLAKLKIWANTDYMEAKIGHGFAGRDSNIAEKYPCANPNGPVENFDCPEDDPYCNCPHQELKPDSIMEAARIYSYSDPEGEGVPDTVDDVQETLREPTDEEIKNLPKSLKECDLVSDALSSVGEDGEKWIGCIWNNQDHPSSCCERVYAEGNEGLYAEGWEGNKFKDYLEYTRTYATYWDTPYKTPLWRNAQMRLLGSQSAVIALNGDLTLKPGTIIKINDPHFENSSPENENKNYTGKWLVTAVEHSVGIRSHRCLLSLSRDSVNYDANSEEVDVDYREDDS